MPFRAEVMGLMPKNQTNPKSYIDTTHSVDNNYPIPHLQHVILSIKGCECTSDLYVYDMCQLEPCSLCADKHWLFLSTAGYLLCWHAVRGHENDSRLILNPIISGSISKLNTCISHRMN